MSRTRQDRVNDALSQLVDRALPAPTTTDNINTAADDERFQRVLERVHDLLNHADQEPSIVNDVNHVADLIKLKLMGSGDTEPALKFGNLYSRLLAQPVLGQKWGILYLLHLLADSALDQGRGIKPNGGTNALGYPDRIASSSRSVGQSVPSRSQLSGVATRSGSEDRASQRDSRVFDEAFARGGLPDITLQRTQRKDNEREKMSRPPTTARRRPHAPTNGNAIDSDSNSQLDATQTRSSHPSEAILLRDLPFTLQGVSTNNLTFSSSNILKFPPTLPMPIISLLHTLAEPALLYKGISAFLDSSEGGLITQSLRAAIGLECRSYLGLVATLESQIRKALVQLDHGDDPAGSSKPRSSALGSAGVTLKRCVLWTRDATMGLRLMSLIIEESRARRGGPLISLIHSLATTHGDPFVGAFAERLLTHVTKPFYDMLRSWIYEGELSDPYLEFFVSERSNDEEQNGVGTHFSLISASARGGAAASVWETKYIFDASMVPSIISTDFAQKVFLIGKSLNFIRHACNDATWVEEYSKTSSQQLGYNDTSAVLTDSISAAYKVTMAHLMHLLFTKFHLHTHLQALKHYLLLTRGDFIALLTQSLSPYLSLPANSQYRHTLTAQLEHAIRGSNAQHDPPEVLRRLDARMLELSHGEIGWDVFTLEYRVEAPLDVIVTGHSNRQYLKVFNFLWRIKRVEFALASAWRRAATGARGVLGAVDDVLGKDWKVARGVMAEMAHFLAQLQNYILFEVIETSWAALQLELANPDATLDDLIRAHAAYLSSITRKGLLGSSSSGSASSGRGASANTSADFTPQLHELLKVMLAYKESVDALYALSVAEFTKRQAREARIERRTARGAWGVTERDDDEGNMTGSPSAAASASARKKNAHRRGVSDIERDTELDDNPAGAAPALLEAHSQNQAEDNSTLPALRRRLVELATTFRARVCVLLGDLATQPDTELRFLGVVMNFNDAYKVVRKGGGRTREREGHRERDRIRDKDRDRRTEPTDKEKDQNVTNTTADATTAADLRDRTGPTTR